jgi:phenylalanyl-tRNA synthetase beta chain
MKISFNWLKEYIEIEKSPQEIAHILTMTGLEVEGVERVQSVKGGLEGVVIGEVMESAKHPNADKLSLTKVAVGRGDIRQIVCGAPNVASGQKVAVALVGTTLYPAGSDEGFKIRKSKIRGELSEGMICAEDEIGIGDRHDGIMVLDTDLPNGTEAREYFKVEDDYIFEIGLTPNRADGTSHVGVARDLRPVLDRDLVMPNVDGFTVQNQKSNIEVIVEDSEGCPRYSGVSISNITIKESPSWLKNKLNAIGQTPINNVVDVTNFVLHELGQPLHAFDADRIKGGRVIVKTMEKGTRFVSLDAKERILNENDLMICDAEGGMCIAGVFGGIDSGVSDTTTNIFLESAYFSPDYVRKTSLLHGLKTDSAFRFERGTDPMNTVYALKRAAMLIQELAGGEISSEVVDLVSGEIEPAIVRMKYKNIDRLIGMRLAQDTIFQILEKLDIEVVEKNDEGFVACVPPYRVDVTREADVIEEILRIYGYDNIVLQDNISSDYLADFPVRDPETSQLIASSFLVDHGFFEISTNSLTKPAYSENTETLSPSNNVVILNKLSEDLGVMRQTLLHSGLEVLAHNINRKQFDLKLFEFGTAYSYDVDEGYLEKGQLSLYMTGQNHAESWISKNKPLEFHDLSGVVLKLIQKFTPVRLRSTALENALFKYGLSIASDGEPIASLGLLNHSIANQLGIGQEVFYAEIDFNSLLAKAGDGLQVQEISKFPEVRRDLSLVFDRSVTFEQVKEITEEKEFSGVLREIIVFDYYIGEKIGDDKKAYALGFILQDKTRTLTDKAIDRTMRRLMNKFESKLGAVIRQ